MLHHLWIFYGLVMSVTCKKSALLLIDVQDCFMPGGNLPVPDGDKVIPVINKIRQDHEEQFSLVILSQDWHCPDHVSFASAHPGSSIYDVLNLTYNSNAKLCFGPDVPYSYPHAVNCSNIAHVVSQTLWPDHCIQNISTGPTSSEFSKLLDRKSSDIVIRKGFNCEIDSYSVFFNNGGFRHTELNVILQNAGIRRVFVMGLALDYCVYFSSLDARRLGYETYMVIDASRGVTKATSNKAVNDMREHGINIIHSEDIESLLKTSNATRTQIHPIISIFILSLCFVKLDHLLFP